MSEKQLTEKEIKAYIDKKITEAADNLAMLAMVNANTELIIRGAIVRELIDAGGMDASSLVKRLREVHGKLASNQYSGAFDLVRIADFIDAILQQGDKPNRPAWLRDVLDGGLLHQESPKDDDQ